jgi:hypothetical protein
MSNNLTAQQWFQAAQQSIHDGVKQPLEVRVGLLMQATSQMASGMEHLAKQMAAMERLLQRLPLPK